MTRIGSLNILSTGDSGADINAKLGAQTAHGLPIGEGPDNPLNWTAAVGPGQILVGGAPGTDPVLTTIQGINATTVTSSAGSIIVDTDLGAETDHGLPIGAGPGNPFTWTLPPTAGQLLIGTSSSTDPVLNTLTPGVGISIANNPGSITITATGATGGFSWNAANTSTDILPNNGYVVGGVGGTVTLTIMGVGVLGDVIEVVGNNRIWSITNGTLNIVDLQGTTLTATTGYDTITLVCVASPNTYVATATQGNITIPP